jgi:hypothetical protein
MVHAEIEGDDSNEDNRKRVATRRLFDPLSTAPPPRQRKKLSKRLSKQLRRRIHKAPTKDKHE